MILSRSGLCPASGSRSSIGWMPVALGLYSHSSSAMSTPSHGQVGVELGRHHGAPGVVDPVQHRAVAEVVRPLPPRGLQRGQPGRMQVHVHERASVEHRPLVRRGQGSTVGGHPAQLHPADLPGGRGRVAVHEHHLARPLERRQRLAAELDQLVLGDRLAGLQDHVGDRLLQPLGVRRGDHHGLGHRRVGQQLGLDLGRRHPDAAGLEHVAGPAEARVVAVGVADVGVAGAQPLALEDLARRVVAGPVPGGGRVAPDEQGARGAGGPPARSRPPRAGRSRARPPGGARPDLARAVGQEDVQHLGHADAVQDVHPEVRGPPRVQRRGERLPGRGGEPDPGQGVRGQAGPEHVREERRPGEEQRRAVLRGRAGDEVRPGRAGLSTAAAPTDSGNSRELPSP